MRNLCIALVLIASAFTIPHARAERFPASLDSIVTANLSHANEADEYIFSGKARQTVSVSVSFGISPSSSALRGSGRLRLIGVDGNVLAAPETKSYKYRHCGAYCWDATFYASAISGFILPEDGTYAVEISHDRGKTGQYSVGISNPEPARGSLPEESMTGSFAIRGSVHEWEFDLEKGETFIRAFRSDAKLYRWSIIDPSGEVVMSQYHPPHLATILFTAEDEGRYVLRLESSPTHPKFAEDIGPQPYTLNAPVSALFDEEISDSISNPSEVGMFSFKAGTGWIANINVSYGESPHAGHLKGGGRMRLFDPDGDIIAEPEVKKSKFRYCGEYCWDATRYFSRIKSLKLVKGGIYTVQIYGWGNSIGSYKLEISEPQNPSFDKALLERYSPVLHIFEDDFRPKEIAGMLNEARLIRLLGEDVMNPDENDLAETDSILGVSDYLDMSGASPGRNPVIPPARRFDKYKTAVYGRSFKDAPSKREITNLDKLTEGREYTILQYWFFYPYNAFVWRDLKGKDHKGNNHEGDWEMIQIIIDPVTGEPLYAVYSWHWAGTVYEWGELELSDGTHPNVYVGKGGHANWGSGGVNRFRFGKTRGDITPETTGAGTLNLYEKSLVPSCAGNCENYSILAMPGGNRSISGDWNSFPGRWGEGGHISGNNGPNSPRFIAYGGFLPIVRWTDPIKWANSPTPAFWSVLANSPVNLSVFDSSGNRVGILPDGSTEANVPGLYEFVSSDTGPEYVTVLTNDELTFRLDGTDTGTMDLYVSRFTTGSVINLSFSDIPLTPSFVGTVTIGESNPDNALIVDSDGDGTPDLNYFPGVSEPEVLPQPVSVSESEAVVVKPGSGGGGRRGGPGRGGVAFLLSDAIARRVKIMPSELVITGGDKNIEQEQNSETERNTTGVLIRTRGTTLAELAEEICEALGIEPDDVLTRNFSARNHRASSCIAYLELLGVSILSDPMFDVDQPLSKTAAGTVAREAMRRHFYYEQ